MENEINGIYYRTKGGRTNLQITGISTSRLVEFMGENPEIDRRVRLILDAAEKDIFPTGTEADYSNFCNEISNLIDTDGESLKQKPNIITCEALATFIEKLEAVETDETPEISQTIALTRKLRGIVNAQAIRSAKGVIRQFKQAELKDPKD